MSRPQKINVAIIGGTKLGRNALINTLWRDPIICMGNHLSGCRGWTVPCDLDIGVIYCEGLNGERRDMILDPSVKLIFDLDHEQKFDVESSVETLYRIAGSVVNVSAGFVLESNDIVRAEILKRCEKLLERGQFLAVFAPKFVGPKIPATVEPKIPAPEPTEVAAEAPVVEAPVTARPRMEAIIVGGNALERKAIVYTVWRNVDQINESEFYSDEWWVGGDNLPEMIVSLHPKKPEGCVNADFIIDVDQIQEHVVIDRVPSISGQRIFSAYGNIPEFEKIVRDLLNFVKMTKDHFADVPVVIPVDPAEVAHVDVPVDPVEVPSLVAPVVIPAAEVPAVIPAEVQRSPMSSRYITAATVIARFDKLGFATRSTSTRTQMTVIANGRCPIVKFFETMHHLDIPTRDVKTRGGVVIEFKCVI